MSHQRRAGLRVWLREDPKEGFPRERGVIEALEAGGVYLVHVTSSTVWNLMMTDRAR